MSEKPARETLELLDALSARYRGLLLSVANGILLDFDEALDIVGEVFARACLETGWTARSEGHCKNWLIRVTRNLCANRRRSMGRAVRYLARYCGLGQAPGRLEEYIEDEARRNLHLRLHALLLEMDREERELITLRYFADLGNEEIAAQLDLPPGTVLSRLSRLRMRLRERLEERS